MALAAAAEAIGLSFLPNVTTLVVNAFDKVGFDLDVIGRERTITMLSEQARIRNPNANIAIWNMHVPMETYFSDGLLESGLVPMGNGGGFRTVMFTGFGHLINKGARGLDNWLGYGNVEQVDNVMYFRPIFPWPPLPSGTEVFTTEEGVRLFVTPTTATEPAPPPAEPPAAPAAQGTAAPAESTASQAAAPAEPTAQQTVLAARTTKAAAPTETTAQAVLPAAEPPAAQAVQPADPAVQAVPA